VTPHVAVSLLGPVQAHTAAGLVSVAGAKLQALLALLALAAPRPVSDDRLIDELWGDDQPAKPANALQAQISQLRRVIGRDAVVREGSGYALSSISYFATATCSSSTTWQINYVGDKQDYRRFDVADKKIRQHVYWVGFESEE
jgi:two-component SAPR family response regulator